MSTVVVMFIFNRGQPALLYLVPGCLGSVIVCAFLRRELSEVINYSEDDELQEVLNETKRHCGQPLDEDEDKKKEN